MRVGPQSFTHHRRTQPPTDGFELDELGEREGAGLWIPLAQQRLDELIEQARLTLGGDAPPTQMARIDACVEEAFRR